MAENDNTGPQTPMEYTTKHGKVHSLEQQETDNRKMGAGYRFKYFLVRGLIMLLGRLAAIAPEKTTYAVCVRFLLFAYKKFPKFRNLARRHLDIAFGKEKSPE